MWILVTYTYLQSNDQRDSLNGGQTESMHQDEAGHTINQPYVFLTAMAFSSYNVGVGQTGAQWKQILLEFESRDRIRPATFKAQSKYQ